MRADEALSAARRPRADPSHTAVTKSLCTSRRSLCGCDVTAAIVRAMDVVAVVIGIAMFVILLFMIEGIERV
jgi:hypothetical protein